MRATWKLWAVLIVVAAGLAVGGHFAARQYLVELAAAYVAAGDDLQTRYTPDRFTWEDLPPAILDQVHAPRIIPHDRPLRRVDPNDPNLDAETLMGIALAGVPTPLKKGPEASDAAMNAWLRRNAAWFRRWSRKALERADSDAQRCRLELAIVIHGVSDPLWDWLAEGGEPQGSPAADADQEAREQAEREAERKLWKRAAELDPNNALWLHAQATTVVEGLIHWDDAAWEALMAAEEADGDTDQSSRPLRLPYHLAEGVTAAQAAEAVLPLLRRAEPLTLSSPEAYLQELVVRAYEEQQRATMWGLAQPTVTMVPLLTRYQHLARCLSFLARRLGEQGREELALELHAHICALGQKLLGRQPVEAPDTALPVRGTEPSAVRALIGLAVQAIGEAGLREFWAARGAEDKVQKLAARPDRRRAVLDQFGAHHRSRQPDPLRVDDAGFARWLRWASLTWWLSVSGLLLAACSLTAALVHLLGRRWRALHAGAAASAPDAAGASADPHEGDSPADRVPLAFLLIVLAVGLGAMAALTLALPMRLADPEALAGLVVWAGVLALVWPAVLDIGPRRRALGRVGWLAWLLLALAVPGTTALVYSTQSQTEGVPLGVPLGAVGAAGLLVCAGLVRTVWVWAARRGAAARRQRARRTRLSAVTLAVGAAVLLAAALATMPATHAAQQAYWAELDPADLHWQQRILDAPLLEQLPPLPERFFRRNASAGGGQSTHVASDEQRVDVGRAALLLAQQR